MADTKATTKTEQKKQHSPILPSHVVKDRLSCRPEKTRDAKTIVTKEGPKDLPEKWEMLMYYVYDDKKDEQLHVEYNALPCFIMEHTGNFGKKRKIFAKVEKQRRIVHDSVLALGEMCREKFIEAVLTTDCSKVFSSAFKVSVVIKDKSVDVPYPDFIKAVVELKADVTIGKTKIPLEKVQNAFETKLLGHVPEEGSEDDPVDSIIRMDNFISVSEDPSVQPTKFIETTGYPTSPKSDSKEDMDKYEVAKVQGSRLLRVWCDKDLRGRLLQEALLPEAGWVQSAKGSSFYTSDYHIMKHIKKGNTAMLCLCSTISFRSSIGKEGGKRAGVYSIVIEEEFSQATLADIRPSDFVAKSSAAAAAYQEEYADGNRTQAPQASGSTLARLAATGQTGEVEAGEESAD
jgi:hypothetical protein